LNPAEITAMKILFFSHSATRTGAPIVLLNLIQWLKNNTSIEAELLIKDDGELIADYEKLVTTHLLNKRQSSSLIVKNLLYFANILFLKKLQKKILIRKLKANKFDLIYSNTLATTDLITQIGSHLKIPCICHVHELEVTIKDFCKVEKFKSAKPYINKYIAVADAVKKNLEINHDINGNIISLIPPPIVVGNLIKPFKELDIKKLFPEANADSFIVCSSGVTGWRKGTDLFILIADIVNFLSPNNNIYFLWVGYVSDSALDLYMHDIRKAGLTDRIKFSGQITNPVDHFAASDICLLLSREDPFPLVCMESAALGKPILCFDDAGGMPDFVRSNDCGSVIPYLSLIEMSKEIIFYAKNKDITTAKGKNASVAINNYDISIIAKKILFDIESIVKN
jgi:glycosyltransferase involved in cell wall biosynthesis